MDLSDLNGPDEIARALRIVYDERGDDAYDEVVSQTDHARQSLGLALDDGASDALAVAAFLHDIGHLLVEESSAVDRRHERIGARFLARWFDDDVTGPVDGHVAAKRYLCATEPAYLSSLSPASVHSLDLQGGPMTALEAADFRATPRAADSVSLRRWDDLGKVPGATAPTLDDAEALIARVLAAR